MYNLELLLSENYHTFDVYYGDQITFVCSKGEFWTYGPMPKPHKIDLLKKNPRTGRYELCKRIQVKSGRKKTITSEKLGLGKYKYKNKNGESIRFYILE
jgi:hypothetical protein